MVSFKPDSSGRNEKCQNCHFQAVIFQFVQDVVIARPQSGEVRDFDERGLLSAPFYQAEGEAEDGGDEAEGEEEKGDADELPLGGGNDGKFL